MVWGIIALGAGRLVSLGLMVLKSKETRYSTVTVGFYWILQLTNSPTFCK